jgi:hypothetical protein
VEQFTMCAILAADDANMHDIVLTKRIGADRLDFSSAGCYYGSSHVIMKGRGYVYFVLIVRCVP